MNVLKLDVFLQPTRKVELGGKTYDVHPVSVRERLNFIRNEFQTDEEVVELFKRCIPDFPTESAYDLPPLALQALVRFCLQLDGDIEKN